MGMHADEKSDGCIVPVKPRTMPSDIGGGDGGGKAAGRGKGELQRMLQTQRRTRHVTEAASPRIGAAWVPNTPKADHVRPETGAGCGKAARPDLRGGRGAILVPTATIRHRGHNDLGGPNEYLCAPPLPGGRKVLDLSISALGFCVPKNKCQPFDCDERTKGVRAKA